MGWETHGYYSFAPSGQLYPLSMILSNRFFKAISFVKFLPLVDSPKGATRPFSADFCVFRAFRETQFAPANPSVPICEICGQPLGSHATIFSNFLPRLLRLLRAPFRKALVLRPNLLQADHLHWLCFAVGWYYPIQSLLRLHLEI